MTNKNVDKKKHIISSEQGSSDPVIHQDDLHGYQLMGMPEFVNPDHLVHGDAVGSDLKQMDINSPDSVDPQSAEGLSSTREQAYHVGFQRGHEEGIQAGHKVGYQQGREDGYKVGHKLGEEVGRKKGLEKGEIEARKQMEDEIRATLATLKHAIEELEKPSELKEEAVTRELLCLVIILSEQVIQRELLLDSSQIRKVVKSALETLPSGSDNVCIYLNKADLGRIESLQKELSVEYSLQVDPNLQAGGCRVETNDSIVDASVEQRLRQCIEQLSGEFLNQSVIAPEDCAINPANVDDKPSEQPEDGA